MPIFKNSNATSRTLIACGSRSTSDIEKRHSVSEIEALA
eukprot:13656.XXX_516280_516396_1 [CDS] Oithona nana genome sequencing.